MNLDALIARAPALAKALQDKFRQEMETIAQSGRVLVTQRLVETGKDINGQLFEPYTEEYERRKRGAVGVAKKESARKRAERRTKEASPENPVGRFRGFVDFTLTGQMLNKFEPVEVLADGQRVTVRVAGRDEFTQDKLDGNDQHRPGFTRISAEEVEKIAGQSAVRMGRFAEEILNAP